MGGWTDLRGRFRRVWQRSWRVFLGGVLGAGVSGAAQAGQPEAAIDRTRESWLVYAGQIQAAIEATLGADEVMAQSMDAMNMRSVVARVWVDRGGQLSAVELDTQAGTELEREIRNRLVGLRLAEPPPQGLRWPVALRLDWRSLVPVEETVQASVSPH